MKLQAAQQGENYGDPGSAAWASVPSESVALSPVPLDAQPSKYIRNAWKDRAYGTTKEASVAAVADGDRLLVRIEWPDDASPNGEFPDAAGAVFPSDDGTPAGTLGDAEHPAAIWYWEDGRGEALELQSRGPGVFRRQENGAVSAGATAASGRWAVVLSGPKSAANGRLGIAVWNGSNEERAGLAAATAEWLPLEGA